MCRKARSAYLIPKARSTGHVDFKQSGAVGGKRGNWEERGDMGISLQLMGEETKSWTGGTSREQSIGREWGCEALGLPA